MDIMLVTQNEGKAREFARHACVLGYDFRWHCCPSSLAWDESADTYLGNATIKINAAQSVLPAGWWALADDSGLEVDALGGAPGLYSAREGGDDPVGWLGRKLQTPSPARFRCTLVARAPDGAILSVEESCEGEVRPTAQGSGGFGYDPIFFLKGENRSFSEMDGAEKDRHSHRGKALAHMLKQINDWK